MTMAAILALAVVALAGGAYVDLILASDALGAAALGDTRLTPRLVALAQKFA